MKKIVIVGHGVSGRAFFAAAEMAIALEDRNSVIINTKNKEESMMERLKQAIPPDTKPFTLTPHDFIGCQPVAIEKDNNKPFYYSVPKKRNKKRK